VGHSGLPVVLTSLTTAGGLVSFASTGVAPAVAIGFALLADLSVAPALMMIAVLDSVASTSTPRRG